MFLFTSVGTDTCFQGLEDAIEEFETLESNDTLDLPYDNIVYYILQNASSSDGSLDCPLGTIPFIAYCGKLYSLYKTFKRKLVVFIHLNVAILEWKDVRHMVSVHN